MVRWLRSLLLRLFPPAPIARGPEPEESPPAEGDPAILPIDDSIDLHGFQPRDIPSVVEEYLLDAHRLGFVEVRIIHGRGKGVQRRVVQSILARHPLVESLRDAPSSRGGWGATLVWLKPRR